MKHQKIVTALPMAGASLDAISTAAHGFRSADSHARKFPSHRSVMSTAAEPFKAGTVQYVGRAMGAISVGAARLTA